MSGWSYLRSIQRAPRSRQRVRLLASVNPPSPTTGIHNHTTPMATYARLCMREGQWAYAHADLPTPPFTSETLRASVEPDREARFAIHPRTRKVHMLAVDGSSGEVVERVSDDQGVSWADPVTFFAGGTHPDIAISQIGLRGITLRTCYDAGRIVAERAISLESGEGTTDSFIFQDSAAVNLAVENDTFRVAAGHDGRWWLHVNISGEGATSLWWSSDDGQTWTRGSGTIAGGTYPGVVVGTDGTLLAWAYKTGNLYLVRRMAGATAAEAAVTMKDSAAAALSVLAGASSLAQAWEGSQRWVLATQITGNAQCSDWWSADLGNTWTRF